MKSPNEGQQILNGLWPKWRALAISTSATNPKAAERAVNQLYGLHERPPPVTAWIDSIHQLPREILGRPFFPHLRGRLIYSVWDRLHEPERLCARIGYDRHTGTFRMGANTGIVFSRVRLSPVRGERPPWLTSAGNIISQFDADALALQALAKKMAMRVDGTIKKLEKIVTTLVSECFAAILFETSCLLVKKPRVIVLNEAQQLSAQNGPAFGMLPSESRNRQPVSDFELYVINGNVLALNDNPDVNFNKLMFISGLKRERLIAYIGWDRFLRLAIEATRAREIHKDKYGRLYQIICGNQLFTVVRVKNSSPEPDGSYRHYVIPVDPQCRPLPDPMNPQQRLGPAQSPTALNAVASTFYMTGRAYADIIGHES